jgi:signal transduction histidine kinase/DNA-binding response OmpR family regulator/ligand-binding sensor domain-containing protein
LKYFYAVVFLVCIISQIQAQENNNLLVPSPGKVFKHLTIEDGLSQNYPLAITQDSRGFLWFGTLNGLNKYDGYSFTVFTHDPYDSTTISGNSVNVIFEDSRGFLWLGTYGESGLNLMDTRTEKFRVIPRSFRNIHCIAEDKDSNIWIGSLDEGLFMIRAGDIAVSDFKFTQYQHQPERPASLSNNRTREIFVDDDNNIWIATDSGLDELPAGNRKDFVHFTFPDTAEAHKINPGVQHFLYNNNSTMWLFTSSGSILFNRFTGQYKVYPRQTDKNDFTYAAARDRDGNIWISDYGRLVLFDVRTETYDYLYKYPDYQVMGKIGSLFADMAGNIWMGSNAYGIYAYFPESERFKSFPYEKLLYPDDQSIRTIYQDSQKDLWFIGGAVLFKWNKQTGEFKAYDSPPYDDKTGYARGFALMEDRNGYLWFDNHRGLGRINIMTDEPAPFIPHPRHDTPVSGMLEDHSGAIWICGSYFLSKLTDISTGQFTSYQYNNRPSIGGTTGMYEDKEGKIWFTSNLGLIRFDRDTEKFTYYNNDPADKNSLYCNITLCICPDPAAPNEKLWVGTKGGGLNLFDKKKGSWKHLLIEDGLPDNVVYGILPDKEGNLWLSTNKGLSKYNPATNQFINYDRHDGLQSNEFNTGSFFENKSGEMFFGGISGFNYFYPGKVANKEFSGNIVFTDFKLFGNSVSANDSGSILKRVISVTDKIKLAYNENNFSLEFAVLDYYAPAKNRFAYKLEGFNNNWIQLGTKREVTFTGLDPGDYVLKVKGSNSDGVWNKNAASLSIVINPPWWGSPWAYGIYFLLILSLLYAVRRYELNRQLWKHSLELETIESFKYKEISAMKSRFFANISHEFRTPLTLIMGPSDRIINETSDQQVVKQAKSIKRNAARLLNLINQLLDLSKLESGKLELRASRSNIVTFIKGLTMSFESAAEEKDITLALEADKDEEELYFDPEKMTKIMTNLLSNAFKYTPEGGTITVTVQENRTNGENPASDIETVEIKVKDTGMGISEKDLPKLFDRFYQVDNSQTREHEGTGIGLALVRDLVELHYGTISVWSKPSVGTEFTINMPMGRDHLRDYEIVDPAEQMPTESDLKREEYPTSKIVDDCFNAELSGSKYIILLVEDNTDVRDFIKDSLRNEFQVEEASNGEQGLRKAEQIIPDLIISDIMMPKMDGIELTGKLKSDEKTSHIPVILLTAKSEQESRLEGLETGADDYLVKPFDTKELHIRIKNLISIRRKLQEKYSAGDYIPPKKPEGNKLSNIEEHFMAKVMEVIEKHLSEEEFSIEQFGKEVGMSRVQLHRKLKALTGKSASNFVRSIRLAEARTMIIEGRGNISEIAYSVGFSSPQYFTRCFKEEYGYPPSDLSPGK